MCEKLLFGQCSEWGCCESDTDMEDFKEPSKKKMKGTDGKEVTQSKWFVAASEEEMEQICKGFVSKNTKRP